MIKKYKRDGMKGDLCPVIANENSVYAGDNVSKIIFRITTKGRKEETCEPFKKLKEDCFLKFKRKNDRICMDRCGDYLFVAADSVIFKFNTRTKNVIFQHPPDGKSDGTTTITSMCVIDEDNVVYYKMPGSSLNICNRKRRYTLKSDIDVELITFNNNTFYVYEKAKTHISTFKYSAPNEKLERLTNILCGEKTPRVLDISFHGQLTVAYVNEIITYDKSGKASGKKLVPDDHDFENIIGMSQAGLYLWVSQPEKLTCFKLSH